MNVRLPRSTPREVIRALERAGFFVHHSTGSHRALRHPDKPELRVVIAYHNRELKRGTLHAIIKQAGLTLERFLELL